MPNQPIIAAPIADGNVIVARRDVGRQRPKRVERRLVAAFELLVHVLFDELHRHVARALRSSPGQSCFQAIFVSSPSVSSSPNCASSFASAIEPGTQAVAKRERNIIRRMISQISRKRV